MCNNCIREGEQHQPDERHQPNKQCPRCGKWFHCSHSGKCWCVAYQLSPKAHALLEEQYTDCLCEDCLKEFEKV